MGFGRLETVILISAVILFLLGFGFIFYKLIKLTLLRVCFLLRSQDESEHPGSSNPNDQRIQNLLARPGIRNILAKRSQSLAATREDRRTLPEDPPPSYDPGEAHLDIETISSYSGPPPSYHSRLDEPGVI